MVLSHCPTPRQTDTDNLTPNPVGSVSVSVQYEHLHTILYSPLFIGLCTSLCVGQCNTALHSGIQVMENNFFDQLPSTNCLAANGGNHSNTEYEM